MPRSLWRWTDQTALSEFGMRVRSVEDELAVELRHRVAHGVGDVDAWWRRQRSPLPARGTGSPTSRAVAVLRGELDVARQVARERAPTASPARTPGRVSCAASFPCASGDGREEQVDARGRPPFNASAAREMSRSLARARRTDGAVLDRVGDGPHRLEVTAGRRSENPASITSTFRRSSWRGDAQLLVLGHRTRRATARRRAAWCRK